jgi:hypothetical protein
VPDDRSDSGQGLIEAEALAAAPALAPVFRDLRGVARSPLRLRRSHDSKVAVWFVEPLGNASGVPRLSPSESAAETPEEAVVRAAEIVQDAMVEALATARRPPVWPECPLHSNHPLSAASVESSAVWCCPLTGDVVAPIGGLSQWEG